MLDRDLGPTPSYPPTYPEPNIGRHTPYMSQPEYRIYELNKRLQNWTEECDNLWWDAFTTEFFEDDAVLTVACCLEDGPKRYTIGRTLIPRYFRSIFDGGATDLYFNLKHSKESFHGNLVVLDCELCSMITLHSKPIFTKVCTEGRLYLEFTFDDLMRIKNWHFNIRQNRELLSRSILATHAQDPPMLEQLSNSITRSGLSNFTLNYLRLCVILEPMQELMSRHKTYNLNPRDCLKTCLFQKWQRMVAPPAESTNKSNPNFNLAQCHRIISDNTDSPTCHLHKMQFIEDNERNCQHIPEMWEETKAPRKIDGVSRRMRRLNSEGTCAEPVRPPTAKRRKRKQSGGNTSSVGPSTNSTSGSKRKSSPATGFSLTTQDVMVVGEPALMGGEFGDEDERLITRLENGQYDAANGMDDEDDLRNLPTLGNSSPWNSKAPSSQESKSDNPTSQ